MQTLTFNEMLWAAIAEPSRRKLVDILLARGESTASKLAEYVLISRQAVSKHMVVLQDAGIVRAEKSGREVRFAVRPEGLHRASSELSRAVQLWDQRLHKIKQIAESIDAN